MLDFLVCGCYNESVMKNFTKNDDSFICLNCGKKVEKLGYTSRDHCPHCLVSLHIDVKPGDRMNDCLGTLTPYDIEYNGNKGYVILYKCEKCGKFHRNKSASDDNFQTILKVMNKTYNRNSFK